MRIARGYTDGISRPWHEHGKVLHYRKAAPLGRGFVGPAQAALEVEDIGSGTGCSDEGDHSDMR